MPNRSTSSAIAASAATTVVAVLAVTVVSNLSVAPVADSTWGAPWESLAGPASEWQQQSLTSLVRTVLLLTSGACLVSALSLLVHAVSRLLHGWKAMAVRTALGAGVRQLLAGIVPEITKLVLLGAASGVIAGAFAAISHRLAMPAALSVATPLSVLLLVPAIIAALLLLLLAVIAPMLVLLHRGRRITSDLAGDGITSAASQLRVQHALAMLQLSALLIVTYGGTLILRASPLSASREVILDTSEAAIVPIALPDTLSAAARSREYARIAQALGTEVGVATPGAWLGLGKAVPMISVCPACFRGQFFAPVSHGRERSIAVMPGTLATMGLLIERGRDFSAVDDFPAQRVAIVSRQVARDLFPSADPVGNQLRIGSSAYTVIGVARDFAPKGLGSPGRPLNAVYFSMLQHPPVRAELALTGGAVRLPGAPFTAGRAELLRHQMRSYGEPIPWFARIAAVLAGAGTLLALYAFGAVMMQMVAIRRRDIAIRLALGARPWHIVGWVTGRGVVLSLYGMAIGATGARLLGDVLSRALRQSDETDVAVLLLMIVAFAIVGFLASYVPARLASRVDPAAIWRER